MIKKVVLPFVLIVLTVGESAQAVGNLYPRVLEKLLGSCPQIIDKCRYLSSSNEGIHCLRYVFTARGYVEMNAALARHALFGETLDKDTLVRLRAIEDAFNEIPPYRASPVLRGERRDMKTLDIYQPGAIVERVGFLSTSKTRPFHGNVRIKILQNDHFSGRDISGYSKYSDEEEVLFLPGSKFQVVERTIEQSQDYGDGVALVTVMPVRPDAKSIKDIRFLKPAIPKDLEEAKFYQEFFE